MKYLRTLLCAAVATMIVTPVLADTYCEVSQHLVVHDGSDDTVTWMVTTVGARRIQIVGHTEPSRGCTVSFGSIGGLVRAELIKKPVLGRAHFVNVYRLYYETDRAGTDEVDYRVVYRNMSTNTLASSIIRLNIQAIDRPI